MESNNDGPFVIGCGYRHIASTKSSLTFPAWLLRLPDLEGRNTHYYWWRSKRDFLLLMRAVSRDNDGVRMMIQPPKTSLEKLAANAPWKRPNYQHCSRLDKDTTPENNYHVSMKKSLLQIDQYLTAIHNHVVRQGDPSLAKAWHEFCRTQDVDTLVSLEDARCEDDDMPATTGMQESSRLGQYFCTKENAKQLVTLVLDWLKQQQPVFDHITFVEPSCGHGQVVWTLLEELEHRPSTYSFTIIACDIDGHAIAHCQQQDPQGQVDWRHGDFLLSSATKGKESVVVCLGGPPYTTGAGSNTTMKRDLPERFVSHCFEKWKARLVAFLMPQRYSNYAWNWSVTTHELSSSTFYIQGKPVTQPSILQCFTTTLEQSS